MQNYISSLKFSNDLLNGEMNDLFINVAFFFDNQMDKVSRGLNAAQNLTFLMEEICLHEKSLPLCLRGTERDRERERICFTVSGCSGSRSVLSADSTFLRPEA